MNKEQKLDLVVRAQVASIRAEQARDRAVLLQHRARPVVTAHERFEKLFEREFDPSIPNDAAWLAQELARNAGAGVEWVTLETLRDATVEAARLSDESIALMRQVTKEWRAENGGAGMAFEWIGCDSETLARAIETALAHKPDTD